MAVKPDCERIGKRAERCLALLKKKRKYFLIYREIQNGAVAKSYMRKGFLIYEEIRKYLTIY